MIFERTRDHRFFQSRMAQAVRRGEIEIHAFSLMGTHFHMLVRSPEGQLSEAMRRIQNEYVRSFNRCNRRDGPLMRGRFRSRRVDTIEYRRMVVRYIDDNALEACLSDDAASYPFGSARHHTSERGCPWLSRDWILAECGEPTRAAYFERFPTRLPDGFREWMERRVLCDSALFDELTPLMRASPPEIREWMERKARLADGTKPGLPIVPAAVLDESLSRMRRYGLDLIAVLAFRVDPWLVLHAGLLRELCGLSLYEIGVRVGRAETTVRRWVIAHERSVHTSPGYAEASAIVARAALDTVLTA